MWSVQQNTVQNTWHFLLYTCLMRFLVALNLSCSPQYVIFCILLAPSFVSLTWNNELWMEEWIITDWSLKFALSWVSFLSVAADLPVGQLKWGKFPEFSFTFHRMASWEFLCIFLYDIYETLPQRHVIWEFGSFSKTRCLKWWRIRMG